MALILVIDDQKDNQEITKRWLLRAGYQTAQAMNGIEGVMMAQKIHPDLILMDLSMPHMNGWAATAQIKASPLTRHLPVIAITALTNEGARQQSLTAGCDDYFNKPVDFPTLLERIAVLLRGSKPDVADADVHW